MKRYAKVAIGVALVGSMLLAGCSKSAVSPEKVLSKALETDEQIAYYGELTATFEAFDEMENVPMREWQSGNASRIEMDAPDGLVTAVTDDGEVTIYEEASETAYIVEDEEFTQIQLDPREQLDMVLNLVKDTHETENLGEEEIAGRPAIHLGLNKRKDEKSLFGDQEIWIDKEHWLVLKMISTSGNTRNEAAYETIDFDVDNDPAIFELDVPEGVEIQRLDEMESDLAGEEIRVSDLPGTLGEGVLYFPNNETHELDAITYLEANSFSERQEVTIDYTKDDQPLFMLTVMEQSEMYDEMADVMTEATQRDEVRGLDAMLMDSEDFRAISWSEGDYDYSIMLLHPDVSWKEVKAWAKEMEEIN